MSFNPQSDLRLLQMKKQKIRELMATPEVTPEMTHEIEGGDFFDDDDLMHTEEQYVEGVQILSTRDPQMMNSGNVLQGSSEIMNYDYSNNGQPTNSQMHNFHNSERNPNQQYSGINYNQNPQDYGMNPYN